jgi:hypothetical protein
MCYSRARALLMPLTCWALARERGAHKPKSREHNDRAGLPGRGIRTRVEPSRVGPGCVEIYHPYRVFVKS